LAEISANAPLARENRVTHKTPLSIDSTATPADTGAVARGLLLFNEARLGPANEQPVTLVVRDPEGEVVGGLLGTTRWNWLYVAKLWVAESERGSGIGSRLMRRAEEIARDRGCIGAVLDTFEFQARPFYERMGYALFGTLEGYPPGYRQYYLSKKL
jgi:GNAT superfamily N-acetyltransferase